MNDTVVSCECGAEVRIAEGEHGRAFRCPKCKQGLAVTVDALVLKSVQLSAGQEAICPICQTQISTGECYVTCPSCEQTHHQECWSEVGGCGTYGCREAAIYDKSEHEGPSHLTAWGDTKKCPACRETIKSIALRCRYCNTEFPSVDPMSVNDLRKQANVNSQLDRFRTWIAVLFGLTLVGVFAPVVLIVATLVIVPRTTTLTRCGPLYVVMGWTAIGLSALYTILLLLFLLLQ